jgi:Zn-dependent M28 family amino/carboxypeptidase
MPGASHRGPLAPMTPVETEARDRLKVHVRRLAGDIGERNVWRPEALERAADYIRSSLDPSYTIGEHVFEAGRRLRNIEASRTGSSEVVVIGAHYDSVRDCAGANDNASGVAALLEIARLLAPAKPERTLRFVAFPNEEAPFFDTDAMGSRQYARRCRERGENVVAMISLETMAYFRDEPGTQQYPMGLGMLGYPSEGNFIAFVGDEKSRALLRRAIATFRQTTAFPSEGLAAPAIVPGIGWSDHYAFWQEGYPAIMVTDTAPFRYPHYHTPEDTPDRIDYDRFARVVCGVARVVAELSATGTSGGSFVLK